MLIVEDVILSENILERKFVCQLDKCKGACCVEGDAGAPLLHSELAEIANSLEKIKPFMTDEGRDLLERRGYYTRDPEGELVTECADDGACVFVRYSENGITQCAIEQAYEAGVTDFKKPISCHLYPIRAKKYGSYVAMNYHDWEICSPACAAGSTLNVPVYEFLKEALTRKMGAKWYESLEEVAAAWEARKHESAE
jgi:hypothetical protein